MRLIDVAGARVECRHQRGGIRILRQEHRHRSGRRGRTQSSCIEPACLVRHCATERRTEAQRNIAGWENRSCLARNDESHHPRVSSVVGNVDGSGGGYHGSLGEVIPCKRRTCHARRVIGVDRDGRFSVLVGFGATAVWYHIHETVLRTANRTARKCERQNGGDPQV